MSVWSKFAVQSSQFTNWFLNNILVYFVMKTYISCFSHAIWKKEKNLTWGFGYDVCPVCFNSFGTKCQNIGDISQQPLLCSCIPPLVDDCLKDGYISSVGYK